MKETINCPHCLSFVKDQYKNPTPTVDAIILLNYETFVLINRKNSPYGLALPGGFVDYGESCEKAVVREINEELNFDLGYVSNSDIFRVYSNPKRDSRGHNISIVYNFYVTIKSGDTTDYFLAGDDADSLCFVTIEQAMNDKLNFAFDHKQILNEWLFHNRHQIQFNRLKKLKH